MLDFKIVEVKSVLLKENFWDHGLQLLRKVGGRLKGKEGRGGHLG